MLLLQCYVQHYSEFLTILLYFHSIICFLCNFFNE